MLHLVKMAVGTDSIEHLGAMQRERWGDNPPIRHFTRHRPKRGEEIAGQGSLFWVIKGVIRVRQPILGFEVGPDAEGRIRCAILLDPCHRPVVPQAMRPFQGWRYLTAAVAPTDLTDRSGLEGEAPSLEMLAQLHALGLL